jgi:hypothetical protein
MDTCFISCGPILNPSGRKKHASEKENAFIDLLIDGFGERVRKNELI